MATEEKEEVEEKKDGGNKIILIVIIVLLLLLLIIGGLVAYFLLASPNKEDIANQQTVNNQQTEKTEDTPIRRSSEALEIGPIYPLDPFTVNLHSANNSRYLKCTINLEIDSPDTQAELDKIKPAIRDVIIRILSSKSVPEISTAKGKEKLKKELKKNLNAILAKGEIRHLYFTAFVIQ